jgi:hypothetical protein
MVRQAIQRAFGRFNIGNAGVEGMLATGVPAPARAPVSTPSRGLSYTPPQVSAAQDITATGAPPRYVAPPRRATTPEQRLKAQMMAPTAPGAPARVSGPRGGGGALNVQPLPGMDAMDAPLNRSMGPIDVSKARVSDVLNRPSMGGGGLGAPDTLGKPPTARPAANPQPSTGSSISAAGAVGMSAMGMAGMGAVAGAGTSYMTGGNAIQGGVAGAMTGGALAFGGAGLIGNAMRTGGTAIARKSARGSATRGTARSFTRGVTAATRGMTNAQNRGHVFGAGAMLGGFMFGGNKSHSRGFNSNRGNRIGR